MSAAREAFERLRNDILPLPNDVYDKWTPVAMHYLEMCNAIEAHRKPDRSALLRMAGNIAGGLVANAAITNAAPTPDAEQIAIAATTLARAIMKEIDKP